MLASTPEGGRALGKAEDKRAAIIAQQAARELAGSPPQPSMPRKRQTNWAATGPVRPRGRGRPPKPRAES
jgi:hypothetical protein